LHQGGSRLPLGPTRPDRQERREQRGDGDQQEEPRRRHDRRPVLAVELPQTVRERRRAGLDGLVLQETIDVPRQAVGRLVAAGPVLLQRLHHDPVELAAE